MRVAKTNGPLKVNAIAGSYVITLGFDLPKEKCNGLLGFSILRRDETGVSKFLEGMKCFKDTDPGFPAGALYPTNEQPIQIFQWADYSAKPGKPYSYKVTALKGSPKKLTPFADCTVKVITESPEGGDQDIYLNRGTAASQEYVRRFGDLAPDEVKDNKAFEWLSRGLYEAMTTFITSCKPVKHSLRIAAYEFNYKPLLQVIKETIGKGVDIKIIYDAKGQTPGVNNTALVKKFGLTKHSTKDLLPHQPFLTTSSL